MEHLSILNQPFLSHPRSVVGIYKRIQDSRKTRKQELDQESDQENKKKKERKQELDHESDQEKKKSFFFS